jgi:hypothetical protein
MKHGDDVMPYMALATTRANNMTEKQECRTFRNCARDLQKVTYAPLWSNSLTPTIVTVHAAGVIQ